MAASLARFADRAARLLRPLLIPFVDFAFPPVCIACDAPCRDARRRVCDACLSSLSPVGSADPLYRRACARLAAGGAIDGLIVPWYLDKNGPLHGLIHELKYGGMTSLGVELGARLAGSPPAQMARCADVIVPVPLHRAKLRARGYNQSDAIARGIASVTGHAILEGAVLRTRSTPSQTALDVPQRRANMPGAFAVAARRRSAIEGKRLLLIDDVITTGATLHACAAVLRAAGARRVIACALALAA